jgi:hypothetical protein
MNESASTRLDSVLTTPAIRAGGHDGPSYPAGVDLIYRFVDMRRSSLWWGVILACIGAVAVLAFGVAPVIFVPLTYGGAALHAGFSIALRRRTHGV